MSNENNSDTSRIIEDIKKSGLPLEIEVGSQFSKRGWTADHQDIFRDEDENKIRAVDIVATRLIKAEFSKFNLD